MKLRDLETYRAILHAGSTQGAAELLGISQSAASRRLAQLEESLGLPLFYRDRSRLVPTQESQHLDRRIQDVLDRSVQLVETANELRSGNSALTTLTLAFPASLTLTIVPEIVEEFLDENYRVRIEVMTGPYDAIEKMVREDRAELGFVRIPVQQAGLTLTPAIDTQSVCVLPRGHPLLAKQVISVADLKSESLVLLGRRRAPRKDVDLAFWKAGLKPRIRVEAHSVGSACGFVARGIGLTIVNALMARDFLHLPIELRPFRPALHHRFAFASSERLPISNVAQSFLEFAALKLKNIAGEKEMEGRSLRPDQHGAAPRYRGG